MDPGELRTQVSFNLRGFHQLSVSKDKRELLAAHYSTLFWAVILFTTMCESTRKEITRGHHFKNL